MNKLYQLLWKSLVILCMVYLITSCSKLTQSNFDKVQPNMTMEEVIAILGEPTSSDSINIAGISGTSATWKNKNTEITVQFINNKVTIKLFNKPNSEQRRDGGE